MVNLFIANTDNTWFDFLASEPQVKEVNFWWPGEMPFRAIQPGELLVFRLKSPRNKIGGFGVFSNHSTLPIQIAWDSFGRANGDRRGVGHCQLNSVMPQAHRLEAFAHSCSA
jgi:putative restriction endonuclease